jgi:uncharacterized protein YbjQ (UPF0145 family)
MADQPLRASTLWVRNLTRYAQARFLPEDEVIPEVSPMIIVTTETIPGRQIGSVIGEVIGVTARSNNPFMEGLKQLNGEANPRRTPALLKWRQEAINEMATAAMRRGADAIIGMKFDNRQITGSWTEICAYGTAVRLVRMPLANAGPARPANVRSERPARMIQASHSPISAAPATTPAPAPARPAPAG